MLATLPLGPNREAGNPLNEMIDELLPQVYRAAELGSRDLGAGFVDDDPAHAVGVLRLGHDLDVPVIVVADRRPVPL